LTTRLQLSDEAPAMSRSVICTSTPSAAKSDDRLKFLHHRDARRRKSAAF
jgi:hypothetical protein